MRVYLSSLGCKLNQSEIDTLAGQLAGRGHQVLPSPDGADLCILNTCGVTHVAAQKSRQALRRLHRENPSARLVATGCYAELAPADLRNLQGVEWVVSNKDKEHLAGLIDAGFPSDSVVGGGVPDLLAPASGAFPRFRTRALVKIQDGCDNTCTYCIIRFVRGPQRSRLPEQVLAEVQAKLAAGYREIVLTGVHIGAYGQDRGGGNRGVDLWALVARILAETDVPRLRLSSIEPWDLPEWAFRLWDEPRLCRHLHLPLQSGCDATLRRMDRRYTAAEFAALVAAARAAIPDLAVTTDVIVGFPGETAAEFAQSLAFVQAVGFARVHIFPFSFRPGTPAARLPDQVPPPLKAERAQALRSVAAASESAFRRQFIGQVVSVLWESSTQGQSGSAWSGLTDNYLRVYTVNSTPLANSITPTRLLALYSSGLEGQVEA